MTITFKPRKDALAAAAISAATAGAPLQPPCDPPPALCDRLHPHRTSPLTRCSAVRRQLTRPTAALHAAGTVYIRDAGARTFVPLTQEMRDAIAAGTRALG